MQIQTRDLKSVYVLGICLVVYLPLVFLGYGSDNDAYGVLDAGRRTWDSHDLTMSRNPGYWVYEFVVYFLNRLGGSVATNLASLVFALMVLHRFMCIAKYQSVPCVCLLTFCIALNPWYVQAATSTMDYTFALFFLVLSAELAIKRRFLLFGISGGIAVAIRLGIAYPLAGIFLYLLFYNFHRRFVTKLLISVTISSMIVGLVYSTSWKVVGENFSFLTAHIGDKNLWTISMRLGRFFYKFIYLYGLATFMTLAVLFLNLLFRGIPSVVEMSNITEWSWLCLICGLANLLLFVNYPIEISYLLPVLFFSYLLVGLNMKQQSKWTVVLLLFTTLTYSVVNINIAKPDQEGRATGAKFNFMLEPGLLLKDIGLRLKLRACDTLMCFESVKKSFNTKDS